MWPYKYSPKYLFVQKRIANKSYSMVEYFLSVSFRRVLSLPTAAAGYLLSLNIDDSLTGAVMYDINSKQAILVLQTSQARLSRPRILT